MAKQFAILAAFIAVFVSSWCVPHAARSAPVTAQDPAVLRLLKAVNETNHRLKSFSADVSISRWSVDDQGRTGPKIDDETGTIRLANPNLMRLELGGSLTVWDGHSAWSLSADKMAGTKSLRNYTYNVGGSMPLYFNVNLPLQAELVDAPIHLAHAATIEGENYEVLEAMGKPGMLRWYIGADNLIHRCESLISLPGNRIRQEVVFRNIVTNVLMDVGTFKVDPPDGAKIVELAQNFDSDDMKLSPGMEAPDLELPTVDGKIVRLSDLWRGNKLTILYIWNTSCGACHLTLPVLESLHRQYADRGLGVAVIHEGIASYPGVMRDDPKYRGDGGEERITRDALHKYAVDYDYDFPQPMLTTPASMKPYWCDSYPSVYFIDGHGKIVARTHAHNPWSFQEQIINARISAVGGS
jgi:outer membrane lipoprotein-sorting protein